MSADDTAARQPSLHELVVVVRAPALAMSGSDGQLRAADPDHAADGWYLADHRVLSGLEVTLDGRPPESLLGQVVGADRARFLAAIPTLAAGVDPEVVLDRLRTAVVDGVRETLTLVSHARSPVHCRVSVRVACDLADLGDVRAGRSSAPLSASTVTASGLSWQRADGVRARLRVTPPADVQDDGDVLGWSITLPPGEQRTIVLVAQLENDPVPLIVVAPRTTVPAPSVRSGDHRLAALVDQSVADLTALLVADPAAPDDAFLCAGAPWYFALFGRDSLWAARMALPLSTDLAAGTLRALARRQGRREDAGSAEQRGKILHEQRRTATVLPGGHTGDLTLPPLYYGTVDATPLWISLLHDAWRWGLPDDQVRQLLPALHAALGWLDRHALDESGFVRYVDRTGHGLANQGWKDSADAVQFADGVLATPPIALCEVQGYAHRAALDAAALLDAFDQLGGDAWRQWAAELAGRFRDAFWVAPADPADSSAAFPAIALDADGRPVDTVTSNIGHLLGSGLLDAAETDLVVARLGSAALDSGVGLRTMSTDAAGFNPFSYHCGSVWSHDTAIAIAGLAPIRTPAATAAAASLIAGLLRAGAAFGYRLPELHAGETARPGRLPAPYPSSCRPQAWSAAAAVQILSAVLGMRPDVPEGVLRLAPLGPSPVGELTVEGLHVAGERLDLHLTSDGAIEVLAAPAGLRVEIIG